MLSGRRIRQPWEPVPFGIGPGPAPGGPGSAPTSSQSGRATEVIDTGVGPGLLRRLLDIAVAGAILGAIWPMLLALAIATRLSTGGSAIYRQLRVGQGGIPFTLLKFRTMRADAAGPEVTAPDDNRVTRLGRLLRRAKLDELPQLINVLIGHMTLVGPRPETLALAARYPADLKMIFRYRPGVTGPGQVFIGDENITGGVVDVESLYLSDFVPRRVAMDLAYLCNPSLVRTIAWLVDTVLYMFRGAATDLTGIAAASSPMNWWY